MVASEARYRKLIHYMPVALWQESDFSLLTSQGVPGDSPLVAPIAQTDFPPAAPGT